MASSWLDMRIHYHFASKLESVHFALSVDIAYGSKNCEICNPSPLRDLLHDIQFITGFALIGILVCRQLSSIRSVLLRDNCTCVSALKIIRKMHKMLVSSSGVEDVKIKSSLKSVHIAFDLPGNESKFPAGFVNSPQ